MVTRILAGIIAGLFALYVIYLGPPMLVPIMVSIVCALGTHELLKASLTIRTLRFKIVSAIFSGSLAFFVYFEVFQISFIAIVFFFTVYLFVEFLVHHSTMKFEELATSFFAVIFIPLAITSLMRIYFMPYGEFLVLIPLFTAWGSDTFALFAGVAFGKHKLAPEISPKKTIEGSIGGICGAVFLMIVFVFIMRTYTDFEITMISAIVIGIAGSILGQIGDLSFSTIKRQYGIKDYGKILPGHGGVLDRFDSVIFTAPVVEILLNLIN